MSAISDFAARQQAFNDQQDANIALLVTEVQSMINTIAQFQSSPGTITPSDQALLDALDGHSQSVASKLAELDAMAPPVLPGQPVPAPLTPAQLSALTPEQLAAYRAAGGQVLGQPGLPGAPIVPALLTQAQVSALSASQVSALTPEQLAAYRAAGIQVPGQPVVSHS